MVPHDPTPRWWLYCYFKELPPGGKALNLTEEREFCPTVHFEVDIALFQVSESEILNIP